MIQWAKMLDVVACTVSTAAALANGKISHGLFFVFARASGGNPHAPSKNISLRRDLAIAYHQVSRLNR